MTGIMEQLFGPGPENKPKPIPARKRLLSEWRVQRAADRPYDAQLDGIPVPVQIIEATGPNNRPQALVNDAGEMTEASGAAIATDMAAIEVIQTNIDLLIERVANQGPELSFGGTFAGATEAWRGKHKLMIIAVVTDGAGTSVATPLMAGVPGYYPCCLIKYVYATATDAAWDLHVTVSGGGLTGMPDLIGLATTVNEVGPDWGEGLIYRGNTDGTHIEVTIQNGGNVVTYYFAIEYWAET